MLVLFCFRYWRYNEELRVMDPGYPKLISIWKGIPESPQGAFVDKENGINTLQDSIFFIIYFLALETSSKLHMKYCFVIES